MRRRDRAFLCAPLIIIAYLCLVLYERIVEGTHYKATLS